MDIQKLSLVVLLLKHGSLEKAMTFANVTSHAIKEAVDILQRECGCTLFNQEGDFLIPTTVGIEFLNFYEKTEHSLNHFCTLLKEKNAAIPKVSISLNACSSLLGHIFMKFREQHSNIELNIQQYNSNEQCDFYIVTEPTVPQSSNSVLLLKEEMGLLINKKNPLAGKTEIQLSDIANERLITQRSNNPVRRIIEYSCNREGFSPNIAIETDNNQAFTSVVESNSAVAIVPSYTSRAIWGESSTVLRIKNPKIYRYIVLKWYQDIDANEALKTVRDFLISYFDALPQAHDRISIHTFGRFDVYVDSMPVYFRNKKSKELLALLVDRRGGIVTMEHTIDCLWEDEPYDERLKRRYRSVIIALRNTLKQYGIEKIVTFQRAGLYLNVTTVQCDLFDFLRSRPEEQSYFIGEYMIDYSWAEHTIPLLSQKLSRH